MTVEISKRLVAIRSTPSPKIKVMGLDPSSHTGIVVFDGDSLALSGEIHFPDQKGFKRLQSIADLVQNAVKLYDPEVILVERPITSGKFNNEFQQQIGTLIRDRLYSMQKAWKDVSPTSLKKWTTGDGRADKKKMMQVVATRWGFQTKNDNVADAFALAKLAQYVGRGDLPAEFKGVNDGDS